MNDTGFEFDPLEEGVTLDYWLCAMTGYYHPDTHTLDGWTYDYIKSGSTTPWKIPSFCPRFYGTQPAWALYSHEEGADSHIPDPIGDLRIQLNTLFVTDGGIPYWGEVGGLGLNVNLPGEALVTKNPIVGEVIEGRSTIYRVCDGEVQYPNYRWRYQTTAFYPESYKGKDVVRTDLIEFNSEVASGSKDTVYTYFWVKGIGLHFLIWGEWDKSDNHVVGNAIGLID